MHVFTINIYIQIQERQLLNALTAMLVPGEYLTN